MAREFLLCSVIVFLFNFIVHLCGEDVIVDLLLDHNQLKDLASHTTTCIACELHVIHEIH